MTKSVVKREMVKIKNLFLACAVVILGLTLAGCYAEKPGEKKASEPATETPAAVMPAATEEKGMAPDEGGMEAAKEDGGMAPAEGGEGE